MINENEKLVLYDEKIYEIEDKAVYEIVALNIYRKRIEKNLSIRRLSLMCNISASHLHKIECGMRHPSVPNLKRIAKALGVEINELLEKNIDNGEK